MADYKYKCLECGTEYEYTKEEVYKMYAQEEILCPACGRDKMLMIEHPEVEEPDQEQLDKELFEAYEKVRTITVNLEKILDMIIGNAGIRQFGTGGNYEFVIINPLAHVDYYSVSPGTYFPHCHKVDPEDFIDMDEVDRDYPLDLGEYRTTSKEVVAKETGIDIEDFEDDEWDKVTEYEDEAIDEWKARATGAKREILQIENSEGSIIAEYKIEWI